MSAPKFTALPGPSGPGVVLVGNAAFLTKLVSLVEQAERCESIGTLEHALLAALKKVKGGEIPAAGKSPRKAGEK